VEIHSLANRDLLFLDRLRIVRTSTVDYLFTLSQLDDFVLDARGDLTILALQLAQFQEFA
jgi:hypothetical protein